MFSFDFYFGEKLGKTWKVSKTSYVHSQGKKNEDGDYSQESKDESSVSVAKEKKSRISLLVLGFIESGQYE